MVSKTISIRSVIAFTGFVVKIKLNTCQLFFFNLGILSVSFPLIEWVFCVLAHQNEVI